MKKLLFLFVFVSATAASAQVEVGLNAGVQPWRRTLKAETQEYDLHALYSASLAYNLSFLRVAFSYNRTKLSYYGNFGTVLTQTYFFAKPMNEYALHLAYYRSCNRTDKYIGVRGSIMSFSSSWEGNPGIMNYSGRGEGFGYGIFAGSNYRIWKGLCLNGEIAVCRGNTEVTAAGVRSEQDFWYIPITLGVHYKLW